MPETRTPEPYWIAPQQFPPYQQEPVMVSPPVPKPKIWLHVGLFLATIFSTMLVGGWIFSAGLLGILTAHEFGHYFAARYWRVPVSLPYFIPFPISLFGTLGAFIRMSSRIPSRRALFDIAAAGPLAGLVLAIPATYLGITMSRIIPSTAIPEGSLTLGEPLLFQALSWLAFGDMGETSNLVLHPLAFAGWAGLFVTALNLLPIGQLDGGHISHALFGARSRLMAMAIFGGLLGFSLWNEYYAWVPLLILLLIFGIRHPRLYHDERPLGSTRQALGWLLGAVFVTCFSLVPINL